MTPGQMALAKMPLRVRFATCGCEGLSCLLCDRPFQKGVQFAQLGLTRYCLECVTDAVLIYAQAYAVLKALAHG